MAGNKINTKTKGKEDRNKANKNLIQNNEENEDIDFSLLRKPILTSVTGFAQARKIFDMATEELKNMLCNECDLLYECKICRNLFRSLANFISHKRVYCKEQFNSSTHGQFFKASSTTSEMLKIKQLEEGYLASLAKNEEDSLPDIDELDGRIPLTKDLTTIVEKLAHSKGVQDGQSEETQVILQKIPSSSVAVFQNIETSPEKSDKMRVQVKELEHLLSRDKAVLQGDGKFKIQSSLPSELDSVIQISDDEDNEGTHNLVCKICEQNFSTQKTLKFHMKYKHLESRLVYPCPDCLEIFSTSWSVYRHLFKVHRKSAAQIRRLRESIQTKAFRMNNPPAFYERRKNKPVQTQKLTEEERLDQENQAWMDNVEGDGDIPRCFGCGRTFERRAALAAHTHTCQPRSRALARRPPETKKIEIQIRKDYNKGSAPAHHLALPLKTTDSNENKISSNETPNPQKSTKVNDIKETEKQIENEVSEETNMEVEEDDEPSNDTIESPAKATHNLPQVERKSFLKLPFAQQAEKSNLTAFRQRIQPDIEIQKLLCKKCDIKYGTVQELYDHMADHYKWLRYACKLCNFKHYQFEKLPAHVKIVHKLKGDSDFYFSTVKAMDGNEALEWSETFDEITDSNDISPDSRRQSRCSSDSSKLSDDSSSSSTRADIGSRKRKMFHSKNQVKRKKESPVNDDTEDHKTGGDFEKDSKMDNDTSLKSFEENSSDMDEIEDKVVKRQSIYIPSTVASRRPVRKKTKPKHEDFEYDLSNLLKMEAQGYRDSQSLPTKSNQIKKKPIQQENQSFYEIVNRDCCGALVTLSKKAVEISAAHIKNTNFVYTAPRDPRTSNIFVRPMIPKTISRGDKNSPKKDPVEEQKDKDGQSPQKVVAKVTKTITDESPKTSEAETKTPIQLSNGSPKKDELTAESPKAENVKRNMNIPAVLPIKFRRQSLEVIKNPIINKNITDFKKAGMKTKILVIKPIHRNKDGTPAPNAPLKFQTIKLKDPSKRALSKEEKSSDQVVVVKVPKVERAVSRVISESSAVNSDCSSKTVSSTNVTENTFKTVSSTNVNENTQNNSSNDRGDKMVNKIVNNNISDVMTEKVLTTDVLSSEDKCESTESVPDECEPAIKDSKLNSDGTNHKDITEHKIENVLPSEDNICESTKSVTDECEPAIKVSKLISDETNNKDITELKECSKVEEVQS